MSAAPVPDPQQALVDALSTAAATHRGIDYSPRVLWTVSDAREDVDTMLAGAGLRITNGPAIWLRFYAVDGSGGVLFVLRNGSPAHDLELLVCGSGRVLNRTVLRAAARWAYRLCDARRLNLFIPASDWQAADYARRAGFRHEGTLRGYYGPGLDGSLWGMTRAECPWLTIAERGPPDPIPSTPPATVN